MRIHLLAGLVALVGMFADSRPLVQQSATAIEEQFHKLEIRWMDALSNKDVPVLEETLAPGFTIIGAGSTLDDATATKEQWLAVGLKRPFPRHTVKILKVSRVGDTAVVQCILTGEYPPMPWIPKGGTLQFLITDTWIQREGRWQVLARHSSLPTAPAPPR